jgi:DNA-binding response OmpR family regulator
MTQGLVEADRSSAAPRPWTAAPTAFVVEDDPGALLLLADLVADAGFRPVGFTRLKPARRAVHRNPPSLILLDDELPDGRGADLVREIRSDGRMRRVRVLFCTGADISRRREISALAPVLGKPFDLSDIERELARLRPAVA